MSLFKRLSLFSASLLLGFVSLPAQDSPLAGGAGVASDKVMLKLIENFKAFSADVTISIRNSDGATLNIPAHIDYAGSSARMDIDLDKASGTQLPAEAMAQVRAMGMTQMSSLNLLDKSKSYLIYPLLKAYAGMPETDTVSLGQIATIVLSYSDEKQETKDGHPCVKRLCKAKMPSGQTQELTLWCAHDLKDFPIHMSFSENDSSIELSYDHVKLEAPAATRFTLPAGYTAYPNMQDMIQAEMMRKSGLKP